MNTLRDPKRAEEKDITFLRTLFKCPYKRTQENVASAFRAKGGRLKEMKTGSAVPLIAGQKGILKRCKTPEGWLYWTE